MKKIILFNLICLSIIIPNTASAHCPLCTAGAGIAALIAAKYGVSAMSLGLFLGAFSVAMGLWIARVIKKDYIPKQKETIALISFGATIWPLKPLLSDYNSIYLAFIGEYGKTIMYNLFIVGAVIGAALLIAAPRASRQLSSFRKGKTVQYQGVAITFVFLVVSSIIIELIV